MDERPVNNFTVIEAVYGRFLVNRHCAYQAEALIKTGRPHIEGELRKVLTIIRTMSAGCVVVDAGANIGLLSVPMAGAIKARGGVVHAFEAQRMMFYALCGAAALNDLDNLHAHHAAVGAAPGRIRVAIPDYGTPQDFGMVSLVDQTADAPGENIALVALDGLDLPRLDFLKIDVEGMEIDVLQGAQVLIARHRPWCWIEYWKVGVEVIREQFADLGYKFYAMDQLNLLAAPAERLAESGITIKASEL